MDNSKTFFKIFVEGKQGNFPNYSQVEKTRVVLTFPLLWVFANFSEFGALRRNGQR